MPPAQKKGGAPVYKTRHNIGRRCAAERIWSYKESEIAAAASYRDAATYEAACKTGNAKKPEMSAVTPSKQTAAGKATRGRPKKLAEVGLEEPALLGKRIACLNANAFVSLIYEKDDSKSVSSSGSESRSETSDEVRGTRRHVIGKQKTKARRGRTEVKVVEVVRCKRMASLNAQAILTAMSEEPVKRTKAEPPATTTTTQPEPPPATEQWTGLKNIHNMLNTVDRNVSESPITTAQFKPIGAPTTMDSTNRPIVRPSPQPASRPVSQQQMSAVEQNTVFASSYSNQAPLSQTSYTILPPATPYGMLVPSAIEDKPVFNVFQRQAYDPPPRLYAPPASVLGFNPVLSPPAPTAMLCKVGGEGKGVARTFVGGAGDASSWGSAESQNAALMEYKQEGMLQIAPRVNSQVLLGRQLPGSGCAWDSAHSSSAMGNMCMYPYPHNSKSVATPTACPGYAVSSGPLHYQAVLPYPLPSLQQYNSAFNMAAASTPAAASQYYVNCREPYNNFFERLPPPLGEGCCLPVPSPAPVMDTRPSVKVLVHNDPVTPQITLLDVDMRQQVAPPVGGLERLKERGAATVNKRVVMVDQKSHFLVTASNSTKQNSAESARKLSSLTEQRTKGEVVDKKPGQITEKTRVNQNGGGLIGNYQTPVVCSGAKDVVVKSDAAATLIGHVASDSDNCADGAATNGVDGVETVKSVEKIMNVEQKDRKLIETVRECKQVDHVELAVVSVNPGENVSENPKEKVIQDGSEAKRKSVDAGNAVGSSKDGAKSVIPLVYGKPEKNCTANGETECREKQLEEEVKVSRRMRSSDNVKSAKDMSRGSKPQKDKSIATVTKAKVPEVTAQRKMRSLDVDSGGHKAMKSSKVVAAQRKRRSEGDSIFDKAAVVAPGQKRKSADSEKVCATKMLLVVPQCKRKSNDNTHKKVSTTTSILVVPQRKSVDGDCTTKTVPATRGKRKSEGDSVKKTAQKSPAAITHRKKSVDDADALTAHRKRKSDGDKPDASARRTRKSADGNSRRMKSPPDRRRRLEDGGKKGKRLGRCQTTSSGAWHGLGEPEMRLVVKQVDGSPVRHRCFLSIQHDDGDVLKVRDCVLVKSGPRRKDLPFVGKVANFWENSDGDLMMCLLWYYRPEHTDRGRLPEYVPGEVFASKHRDAVPVACIDDRCDVLALNKFNRYKAAQRLQDQGSVTPPAVVPSVPGTSSAMPPLDADTESVFLCRRVYDIKLKRVLKNPFSAWRGDSGETVIARRATHMSAARMCPPPEAQEMTNRSPTWTHSNVASSESVPEVTTLLVNETATNDVTTDQDNIDEGLESVDASSEEQVFSNELVIQEEMQANIEKHIGDEVEEIGAMYVLPECDNRQQSEKLDTLEDEKGDVTVKPVVGSEGQLVEDVVVPVPEDTPDGVQSKTQEIAQADGVITDVQDQRGRVLECEHSKDVFEGQTQEVVSPEYISNDPSFDKPASLKDDGDTSADNVQENAEDSGQNSEMETTYSIPEDLEVTSTDRPETDVMLMDSNGIEVEQSERIRSKT